MIADERFEEEIVADVLEDFRVRQEARRPLELIWRLNMNFLVGNQYSEISARGEIEDFGKQYFWQEREVFNHIAPMIETRLAKISRVKAGITVRPATGDDGDTAAAKLSTAILKSIKNENRFNELISEASMWSEITGTAFYKVVWNSQKGRIVGFDGETPIAAGDVEISVCPPFEIFPECLSIPTVSGQGSIIHAKAFSAAEVKLNWGVDVQGAPLNVFSLGSASTIGGFGYNATTPRIVSESRDDCVLVIEKYQLPSEEYPYGRLIIVAGDKLVYCGSLPFINGNGNTRTFPFAKQTALDTPGSFFGTSLIERTIPVQRSYNVVKNRKHEFLNRISMGVLAVEDGSVDTDNLEEEGLSPGKILVYRQGSNPPSFMNPGDVPSDFSAEESRLLQEFVLISGVSEIMKSSELPANISSGRAISLLIEQDDGKMVLTAQSIRAAVREVSRQILRLYKQYATMQRIARISGDNGSVELQAFCGNDLTADDLVFDSDNELSESVSTRKNMVLELVRMGVLTDENGRISNRNKNKVLEMLGVGNWESARDIEDLQCKKAIRENHAMEHRAVTPMVLDDHELHVEEHTKYLLQEENDDREELRRTVLEHINKHRELETAVNPIAEIQAKLNQ